MYSKASLIALLPLASAHFSVTWPEPRGSDEEGITNYPCGGFDTPSRERTTFPLAGGPIQLDLEHTTTNFQVLIALGNDPTGDDYHTVLVPTFAEQGPNDFCLGAVTFPSSLNVAAGDNATIQVQSSGDPTGGLYSCIDITFGSTPLTSSQYNEHCTNSTGIRVTALNTQANANETQAGHGGSDDDDHDDHDHDHDDHDHDHSSSSSSTATTAAAGQATSSSSTGIAAQATAIGALAAGVVGVAGMLVL